MPGFMEKDKYNWGLIFGIIGVVGSVFSIISVWLNFSGKPAAQFRLAVIILSIAVVSVALVLLFMILVNMRDARKVERLSIDNDRLQRELNDALERLLQLNTLVDRVHDVAHLFRDAIAPILVEDEPCIHKTSLERVVDAVKQMMDLVTGKQSAVCIKAFVDESQLTVGTLCRDRTSTSIRGSDDHNLKFDVEDNTAFRAIVKDKQAYWVGLNLPNDPDYHNQRPNYAHCYKSTIVAPIRCKDHTGKQVTLASSLQIGQQRMLSTRIETPICCVQQQI